jgi:hypothetical protein
MSKTAAAQDWHPCNKEQGFCPSMAARIKFPGERGYGFFALMILKKADLNKKQIRAEETLMGAMYKSDAKDKGIMMNFCPFCGATIDWFRQKEKPPKEEKSNDVQEK